MKRIMAVLAALVLAFGLASAPAQAAAPVNAQAVNGCDDNMVCLYDWINNNYASGFWQRSLSSIRTSADGGVSGCVNLSNHQWHDLNGSPNGTASSGYVIRANSGTQQWRVQYYDYLSCGAGGGPSFFVIVAPGELNINTNYNSLDTCDGGSCSLAWENRISSIKVTYWP